MSKSVSGGAKDLDRLGDSTYISDRRCNNLYLLSPWIMETISIRPDLKALILDEVAVRGVSPSDVIDGWRLGSERQNADGPHEDGAGIPENDLRGFLSSSDLQRRRYAIDRYLAILTFLYRIHGEDLDRITTLGGHVRTYFAKDRDALVKHGVDVNPKKIPDTPYWAISRLSNRDKREILGRVFEQLGYDAGTVSMMRSLFRSG